MSDAPETDWRMLLTPQERAAMLSDIARVSLTIGMSPVLNQPRQDLGIAAGPRTALQSPVERLCFMEHILPGLSQAVRQICGAPLTRIVSQTRPITPPVRARSVGTQAILRAARRGPSAPHWDETITTCMGNTPENRAVKSFLHILQKDSTAIAELAAAREEREAQARAEYCAAQIGRLLAETFWEAVTPDSAAWTAAPTQRAALRPEYALLFREMARFRGEFVFDRSQPLLTVPQRETWRLYETWCLFAVADALIALGFEPTVQADFLILREGRLLWTLAPGEPSRLILRGPQGRRLFLRYNQTFAQGFQSLSRTMQPDITLAADEPGEMLWILDAKFKPYALPGEEGEDINQMHAYRDAIVGSRGQRRVAHAWCLFAGMAASPNRDRITYGAVNGPVGALCLRPGSKASFTNLCGLLAEWLRAETPRSERPEFPETEPAPR